MSAFAVKLDENLSRQTLRVLRDAGYDAEGVHDEGLSGASDPSVWEHACAEGRLLITLDLDFSDVRQFPPGSHPGILLIRGHDNSSRGVTTVLERVLAEGPLDDLSGCLVVADQRQTRVRR